MPRSCSFEFIYGTDIAYIRAGRRQRGEGRAGPRGGDDAHALRFTNRQLANDADPAHASHRSAESASRGYMGANRESTPRANLHQE